MNRLKYGKAMAAMVLMLTLLVTGCQNGNLTLEKDFPVTVAGVDIAACPQKVVSLSPLTTEVIYALGSYAQLIGVSDYDVGEDKSNLTRYGSVLNPKIKDIIDVQADLVLYSGTMEDVAAQELKKAGIPAVAVTPAKNESDFLALYETIGTAMAGALAGKENGSVTAHRMVEAMQRVIPAEQKNTKNAVLLLDDGAVATPDTFGGWVLICAGVANAAVGQTNYQMTAEEILATNPDYVICDASMAQTLQTDTMWSKIPAISEGRVVEITIADLERQGTGVEQTAKRISNAVYGTVQIQTASVT